MAYPPIYEFDALVAAAGVTDGVGLRTVPPPRSWATANLSNDSFIDWA